MVAKKKAPAWPGRFRRRNYGNNHAYYLTMDDGVEVKLDGVTTLIGAGKPKPQIAEWKARMAADEAVNRWEELSKLPLMERRELIRTAANRDRDWAAQRGTEVHDLAERIAHGHEVEVPAEIRGHVESAVKFLDDFEVEVILTESSVFHERALYAGTFDLLLRSNLPEHKGKVVLADWKTNRSGIFSETALQLTAYARATHYTDANREEHPLSELGITDTWAIWIRSDGYSVYPMENSADTWASFAHVAGVARSVGDDEVAKGWKGPELRPGVAA